MQRRCSPRQPGPPVATFASRRGRAWKALFTPDSHQTVAASSAVAGELLIVAAPVCCAKAWARYLQLRRVDDDNGKRGPGA